MPIRAPGRAGRAVFRRLEGAGPPPPSPISAIRSAARRRSANPVGETACWSSRAAASLTYAVLRPWQQVTDNIEYNRGLLIDASPRAIINRRLEKPRARGGSYLYAGGPSRTRPAARPTAPIVDVTPLTTTGRRRSPMSRGDRRALATPPSQAEIDREVAEFDVSSPTSSSSAASRPARARRRHRQRGRHPRGVGAPETILEVFRAMRDRFTPRRSTSTPGDCSRARSCAALY
jgi:zinc protease